jgi:putative membrane protein
VGFPLFGFGHVKQLSVLLAFAGLGLGTAVIGWFGVDRVIAATLTIGWIGFMAFTACQLLLFVVCGLAWNAIMPRSGLLWIMTWGRMVRDSAANCLPFTVMGGILAGARTVAAAGVPWPLALGSSVVDVTAEFLGQIAFIALGLILLLVRAPGSGLALPAALALAAALAGGASFVFLQLGADRVFRMLGSRIAGSWFAGASARLDMLQAELTAAYQRPARLALGSAIHFVGWLGTGFVGWVAYRLLGAHVELASVLAIEALLQVVLSAAFLVPGGIGVQEAGYASIGAAFGLPPELSLGVSLLRRARDLALGIPILLMWQATEARRAIREPVSLRKVERQKSC